MAPATAYRPSATQHVQQRSECGRHPRRRSRHRPIHGPGSAAEVDVALRSPRCAPIASTSRMLSRVRHGDDLGAAPPRQLHGGRTHAARRASDQHRFARSNAGTRRACSRPCQYAQGNEASSTSVSRAFDAMCVAGRNRHVLRKRAVAIRADSNPTPPSAPSTGRSTGSTSTRSPTRAGIDPAADRDDAAARIGALDARKIECGSPVQPPSSFARRRDARRYRSPSVTDFEYQPMRVLMSVLLMAAAPTRTSTSPAAGTGTRHIVAKLRVARSRHDPQAATACIVAGTCTARDLRLHGSLPFRSRSIAFVRNRRNSRPCRRRRCGLQSSARSVRRTCPSRSRSVGPRVGLPEQRRAALATESPLAQLRTTRYQRTCCRADQPEISRGARWSRTGSVPSACGTACSGTRSTLRNGPCTS